MYIHSSRHSTDQISVICSQCTAGNDSPELFVRIFGSIQRNGKSSHAVSEKEHRNIRIFFNGHIHHYIGIIQKFIKIRIKSLLTFGSSMSSVIKTVGTDSYFMKLLRKIIVPALMLTETVNDHDHSLIICCRFLFQIQFRSVKRCDHTLTHSKNLLFPAVRYASPLYVSRCLIDLSYHEICILITPDSNYQQLYIFYGK